MAADLPDYRAGNICWWRLSVPLGIRTTKKPGTRRALIGLELELRLRGADAVLKPTADVPKVGRVGIQPGSLHDVKDIQGQTFRDAAAFPHGPVTPQPFSPALVLLA